MLILKLNEIRPNEMYEKFAIGKKDIARIIPPITKSHLKPKYWAITPPNEGIIIEGKIDRDHILVIVPSPISDIRE